MKIERRFFAWNEEDNNTPIKLGDKVSDLVKQQVIVKREGEDSEFMLSQNEDIWIGAENGLVQYIFFTNHSGDQLLGFDPFDFPYPATEPITQFLKEKYRHLTFTKINDVKENYSGDLLYLIFKDYVPSSIFIMRA